MFAPDSVSVPLPAFVSPPVAALITPEKLEVRLFVALPTVRVNAPLSATLPVWFTVVVSLNAPMVWLAPTPKVAPSATSTVANVPSAVA